MNHLACSSIAITTGLKKKKVFLKLEFEGVGCVQYVHACVYVSVSMCVHLAPS